MLNVDRLKRLRRDIGCVFMVEESQKSDQTGDPEVKSGLLPRQKAQGAVDQFLTGIRQPQIPAVLKSQGLGHRLLGWLKTFIWVLPLTVMIWVYAEREQQAIEPNYPIRIEIKSSSLDRVVSIVGSDVVIAELQGPREGLDKVREVLGGTVTTGKISLVEDLNVAGETTIPVAQRLAGNPLLANNAVSISRCRPESLKVRVDQLVTRDFPVKAEADISGAVVFSPDRISVRISQSQLDRLGHQDLFAYVDLTEFMGKKPGRYEATIRPQFRFSGESLPNTPVRVKVEISQSTEQFIIPSMPVFVAAPKGFLDQFSVEYPESLRNIKVSGPPERINMLREATFVPKAYLELTRDNAPSTDTDREREGDFPLRAGNFHLPPDVTVAEDPRTIHYTIRRREILER